MIINPAFKVDGTASIIGQLSPHSHSKNESINKERKKKERNGGNDQRDSGSDAGIPSGDPDRPCSSGNMATWQHGFK